MEENQNTKETVRKEYEVECHHSFWRTLLNGLLIFLGAFCAFYTVADWHMKSMMRPAFDDMPGRYERNMMRKEMRAMNKMFADERKISKKAGNVIHIKQTPDFYKIAIDLRAFDNNENNVQVTTNGNILTINGRSIRKSKHNEQISEFQQQYMFGSNVKLEDLSKSADGNYLIITIPISKDDDEQ